MNSSLRLGSDLETATEIVIEPWADCFLIHPGGHIKITADNADGFFEVELRESACVVFVENSAEYSIDGEKFSVG